MDAYVFIREMDDAAFEHIGQFVEDDSSPLRFLASVSGEHDGIAAISADDFRSIEHSVKNEVRASGARGTDTAYVIIHVPPIPMPKVRPPERFEAFVRCRVKRGKARLVAEAAAEMDGFMGAAIVAGSFDVLLEFGAESFERLGEILASMHEIDGLRWSKSSLAEFGED